MNYVYGPIPSRRLGQSLGIDPIPLKTCNWNCVYCQLGRSVPLTNQRRDYVPPAAVVAEVREALAAHPPGAIDWVSFESNVHSELTRTEAELNKSVEAVVEDKKPEEPKPSA